jgi:hypothetical protein
LQIADCAGQRALLYVVLLALLGAIVLRLTGAFPSLP